MSFIYHSNFWKVALNKFFKRKNYQLKATEQGWDLKVKQVLLLFDI